MVSRGLVEPVSGVPWTYGGAVVAGVLGNTLGSLLSYAVGRYGGRPLLDRYGRCDILMTNAAVQPPGTIGTIQLRHWELEFRVNVHGTFYCIRAFMPSMQEHATGNIITISSIAASRGGSHYGATKRAIESMTVGLAGGVLVWLSNREREPEFGGRSLSKWVSECPPFYVPSYE